MSFGNFGNGRKTVTTAGTAVKLVSAITPVKRVIITPLSTNTGVITVGNSGVLAAAGSENGLILKPGAFLELFQEDLFNLYINSTVNGEGVTFIYEY